MPANSVKTILILAANPIDTPRVRLDQEEREIGESLKQSRKRKDFVLKKQSAVRDRDIRRALLDDEPQIVHFCGHGYGLDGLAVEDGDGKTHLFPTEALAELFEFFKDQVECVVLNACFSEVQARAIGQHIPFVVGMSQDIGDRSAIEFAVGFYDALGAGRSYPEAYQFGRNAIAARRIPESLIPKLYSRQELSIPAAPPRKMNPPRRRGTLKPKIPQLFLQKAWWLMAPILIAWTIAGWASADAEGQSEDLAIGLLAHGGLAGAFSGFCGGWALQRLNRTIRWEQALLCSVLGAFAGAVLWFIFARLYVWLFPGILRSSSGSLGLGVGITIVVYILGIASHSQDQRN
jgi:CHAT domain